jgi:hypothetical protein
MLVSMAKPLPTERFKERDWSQWFANHSFQCKAALTNHPTIRLKISLILFLHFFMVPMVLRFIGCCRRRIGSDRGCQMV